jgi:hypothetical protein
MLEATMSLHEKDEIRRKAGQMLFIGLPGTHLDKRLREMLREVQPGGVILFGRNVESAEQVALLNAQIRDALGGRVLIGVDQEGGWWIAFATSANRCLRPKPCAPPDVPNWHGNSVNSPPALSVCSASTSTSRPSLISKAATKRTVCAVARSARTRRKWRGWLARISMGFSQVR